MSSKNSSQSPSDHSTLANNNTDRGGGGCGCGGGHGGHKGSLDKAVEAQRVLTNISFIILNMGREDILMRLMGSFRLATLQCINISNRIRKAQ